MSDDRTPEVLGRVPMSEDHTRRLLADYCRHDLGCRAQYGDESMCSCGLAAALPTLHDSTCGWYLGNASAPCTCADALAGKVMLASDATKMAAGLAAVLWEQLLEGVDLPDGRHAQLVITDAINTGAQS